MNRSILSIVFLFFTLAGVSQWSANPGENTSVASASGEEAIPQMVQALDHADEEVVTAAMNLLTSYGAGEWIREHAERLVNHPFWVVRAQVARSAVDVIGAEARALLVSRLEVEEEAVVRQQLQELLASLPSE